MNTPYTVRALIEHLAAFPQSVPVYVMSDPDGPAVPLAGPFTNTVFASEAEHRVVLVGVFPEEALSANVGQVGSKASVLKSANTKEELSIQGGGHDLPAEGIDG